ncbi:isoprenylcysteine carboxylmethyltransferase family protein [Brevundimonas sp.]|uniref:methyltransferase family protein n=1 Tax=Brevundimonas sp. TaxID=1871086 RepID=UPI0025BF8C6F|nr:isoprenylcysteine carboxylmethyltransferase family protein [Brevundimonas sp.]
MTTIQSFDLQAVQKVRKAAVLAALIGLTGLTLVSQSATGLGSRMHEGVEAVGLAALVFAIVGRAWCSLYIGGRKKAEIVSRGPYSITRNPLYVFSFFGAFGAGAQSGSLTIGALFMLASYGVFFLTVRREEAWLTAQFGAEYEAYRARTPRFLPRFSLWRDETELSVRPSFFLTTIRDGLVFLLAIPLFELIDAGQAQGWLKVLAYLP